MSRLRRFRTLIGTVMVFVMSIAAPPLVYPQPAEAFTAQNLTVGSQGYDVNELQSRLKQLGYYHGKVDGVFGWKTYWAVRTFQHNFGIKVTGRVDMPTKLKLVGATKNWHYSSNGSGSPNSSGQGGGGGRSTATTQVTQPLPNVPGVSQSDMRLMQHVVYGEARGESFQGQVAIAAVILNRIRDPRFPHSVPAIVFQPGAFTAVADGQVNLQPNAQSMKAVLDAVHGMDPSQGAVYYFNPATATSPWIWSRPQITQIGKHIFCR